MDPLVYLETKFEFDRTARSPIELRNVGRDWLARFFGICGFRRGVEIGVERGLYSEVLCRENPGVELFCVDAWMAYRGYRDHVSQPKLDGFYEEAQERLKPYPRAQCVRKFSLEAVNDFAPGSLDFVFIDGNHSLQHCINDIAEWSKKVRVGGIISGHDYAKFRLPNQIQVVQAVNAWTDANEIKPWFLLGTQAKVEGEVRDTARSWFWVKPEHKPVKLYRGKPVKQ